MNFSLSSISGNKSTIFGAAKTIKQVSYRIARRGQCRGPILDRCDSLASGFNLSPSNKSLKEVPAIPFCLATACRSVAPR